MAVHTSKPHYEPVARLVDARAVEPLDALGATIQLLTALDGDDGAPCVIRGVIAPGVSVPLHSHPDLESFVGLAGELEGLVYEPEHPRWVRIGAGDVFTLPAGVKHAFRNRTREPVESIIVTTVRLGRFFAEIGRPPGAGRPSAAELERFLGTAVRYGHWNATPAENAAVGITLPELA